MLICAALLLLALAAMHSVLGGRDLINRICVLPDLPVILGSRRMTVLTLQIGWHLLSIFWIALALLLVRLQVDTTGFRLLFLDVFGGLFLISGIVALVAGRGRHLSWVFFLPAALLLFLSG